MNNKISITWYQNDFDFVCYSPEFKEGLMNTVKFLLIVYNGNFKNIADLTGLSEECIIRQLYDYSVPVSYFFIIILSWVFNAPSSYFTEGFDMTFIGESWLHHNKETEDSPEDDAEEDEEGEDTRDYGDWDDLPF